MKKGKYYLASTLLFTLLIISSACASAPLPAQEQPVYESEQPVDTAIPPENYICGLVENWTDTGAFSPVMTVYASGQVIWLDALIDDMLTNYAGQLPSNFMIFDPLVSEEEDLSGGKFYELAGFSRYELVGSCP